MNHGPGRCCCKHAQASYFQGKAATSGKCYYMAVKNSQLQAYEKKLMLIGIPVFLCAFFMGTQQYNQPAGVILHNVSRMLLLALVQWRLVWYFNVTFRIRYPRYHQIVRRMLFTIAVSSITGLVLDFLIFNVPDA